MCDFSVVVFLLFFLFNLFIFIPELQVGM